MFRVTYVEDGEHKKVVLAVSSPDEAREIVRGLAKPNGTTIRIKTVKAIK